MTPKRTLRTVWVLLGHYRHKPSDPLGVYRTYKRGKAALDSVAFTGAYAEVCLSRMEIKA